MKRGHERSRRPTPRTLEDKLALYVIVDARTPVQLVADLLDAGVGAVQLRDKSLPPGDQVQPARRLQRLCRAKDALFFVNDHVDVALAVSADGVHLGQNDRSLREARLLLGPDALIGATVRTVEQAEAAAAQGADYLGVGPIYESVTKPGRTPLGVDVIKRIRAAVRLPLVAISGIAAGRAAPVIEAGATGAAVIAGILARRRSGASGRGAGRGNPERPAPTRGGWRAMNETSTARRGLGSEHSRRDARRHPRR